MEVVDHGAFNLQLSKMSRKKKKALAEARAFFELDLSRSEFEASRKLHFAPKPLVR